MPARRLCESGPPWVLHVCFGQTLSVSVGQLLPPLLPHASCPLLSSAATQRMPCLKPFNVFPLIKIKSSSNGQNQVVISNYSASITAFSPQKANVWLSAKRRQEPVWLWS